MSIIVLLGLLGDALDVSYLVTCFSLIRGLLKDYGEANEKEKDKNEEE